MDEAETIATRRKRQTKISRDGKRAPPRPSPQGNNPTPALPAREGENNDDCASSAARNGQIKF